MTIAEANIPISTGIRTMTMSVTNEQWKLREWRIKVLRKYKRYLSKINMTKAGYWRICKPRPEGSYFSRHWREFVR